MTIAFCEYKKMAYHCGMEINQSKINERFYPAKEKKNFYEVLVNYTQLGVVKHSKKYSMCGGQKLVGINAWDVENTNYVTQEVYDKLFSKCATQRFKQITKVEFIWEDKKNGA